MASSSYTNTSITQKEYDVFLSFRGEDTRNSFTSHLNEALNRKGIETFIDDKLVRGDEISESLLNTIEGSTISIIIFSEGYASSRWCLDELVKILECKNKRGQIVIPVFYHVDPSDVRNQTGNFGNSFSNLEERFKEGVDKLQNWRNALREAANLSGFDSQVTGSESDFIKKIVDDILKKLNVMSSTDLAEDLVGRESRIHEIESLLNYGSTEVYTLGIWGIGGMGKTTIARAIFNKISNNFESSCFIENIREQFEKNGGLSLQRELFFALLGDENLKIGIPYNNSVVRRLCRQKVLIIFDDVTGSEQIKFLIGSLNRFKLGSLIVITTRDKQVLENCEVKKVYEMTKLVYTDALKLFSQHAFKQYHPNVDYEKLSVKVMQYADGVPLALGVLGRLLYRKEKEDWESEINKLKRIPNMDIQNVLKVSYDNLDDDEKNIFLDIACFFKGESKDCVKNILEACGFSAKIGITVLVDKGLIFMSDNMITMHDLLQEMGREIVRQESVDDPHKRSRLWHPNDICEVLISNTGTKRIQGISLNMDQVKERNLNFDTFKKMCNLRFLRLYGGNKFQICDFEVSGFILTKLRYFEWEGYPLKSFPSNIRAENLVSLKLPFSKVKQLWDGVQNLVNLIDIDLAFSQQLRKLPDLSSARKLERLILHYCYSLVETHPSIQNLDKLVLLDLRHCRSLKRLPSSIHSEYLEFLGLSYCSNLERLPEILSCNLESLCLYNSGIKECPSSMEFLSRLDALDLHGCSRLNSLPNSLCKLTSLKNLDLFRCSNLQRLPDEFGNLEALKYLTFADTSIREPPLSIVRLKNLDRLEVKRCRGIGRILPSWMSSGGMHSVSYLTLIDCGIVQLPENLDQLSSIEELNLSRNNFERIPESIVNLSKLKWLDISYCERLRSLPKLPCSLTHVTAHHCKILEGLSNLPFLFTMRTSSRNIWFFKLTNCFKLDQNEVTKFFEDGLPKINLYSKDSGCICFPGSEIPEWFEHQSKGSSIEFMLPSDVSKNKLVGIAYCVNVAIPDQHDKTDNDSIGVMWKWKFKEGVGRWSPNFTTKVRTIPYVESDHVILGYQLFCEYWPSFCRYSQSTKGSVRFFVVNSSDGVKKYGIHLFYSKDFEEYRSRSFSIDEEEETHLQPKRLKYTRS